MPPLLSALPCAFRSFRRGPTPTPTDFSGDLVLRAGTARVLSAADVKSNPVCDILTRVDPDAFVAGEVVAFTCSLDGVVAVSVEVGFLRLLSRGREAWG